MNHESGKNFRSHGLSPDLLKLQADSIGIPLITSNAAWDEYEKVFTEKLISFKSSGITAGVFGDIDLDAHRLWEEKVCSSVQMNAILPLWKFSRAQLIKEFVDENFKAMIVVVNTGYMPDKFLGRVIDKELIVELESIGVDPCGENGEYHSFVFDGPIFLKKIDFKKSDIVYSNEYAFLQLKSE
ncbi:MAG: diphthine--ammonia ligase [Fibrobacter sp.]|nr:diphthine--ammonia ligase [Fibrobacter sp.]